MRRSLLAEWMERFAMSPCMVALVELGKLAEKEE
jgi:hypothetical protein